MRYFPSKIEKKWQNVWMHKKIYEPDLKRAKKPFYNLMMFPYPSAEGLHVGNMYAFTGADIYGRFKRMQGFDVFQPIGLDGFGIHSENYALKIGKHPADQAKISEKNFYRQLHMIGNGFAWQEQLETYDPEYYKWTQWIFVQMFKRGLAYRKKAAVNWCPSCKTVLADEQVISGECERCGTAVIKKELEQWFFRITNYAERLLKNLEKIDWSERVKIAQRNWIGRSEGAEIEFRIKNHESRIKIFTTRPDTIFGATYVVLAPEHPLIKNLESRIQNLGEINDYIKKAKARVEEERVAERKEKIGIELKGIKAINPANGEEIPIWVADYVLGNVGTGAIMAVPAHDERDLDFARKYNLPMIMVVCPHYPEKTCPVLDHAYEGEGHLVASGKFDGMPSKQAKREITKFVGGRKMVKYRLRDWLVSRQRYWGPPIPMIFCEKCGWSPVPEKGLPVKLPYIKNFHPTGTEESPLASVEKFYKVRCPKCRAWARRETDVSDSFLDSAWYYLRYTSLHNKKQAWDLATTKKWLPVDMYIGGPEHAVLHLLYARFLAMVFNDWELIHTEEPFKKFFAHAHITRNGAKMSKSRGNIVSVDDYVPIYGADAGRIYLMFLGPFEQGGDFNDTGIKGITRFLERVWKFVNYKLQITNYKQNIKSKLQITNMTRTLHKTIKKVTEDIEGLQYNTAISALMILLNEFEKKPEEVEESHLSVFLRLLAPFAPYMSEELWQNCFRFQVSNFSSIHCEPWPKYNPKFIQEDTFELVVQVNGKVRDKFKVPVDISEKEVIRLTLKRERVANIIGIVKPRKVIFVPGRLINIVL